MQCHASRISPPPICQCLRLYYAVLCIITGKSKYSASTLTERPKGMKIFFFSYSTITITNASFISAILGPDKAAAIVDLLFNSSVSLNDLMAAHNLLWNQLHDMMSWFESSVDSPHSPFTLNGLDRSYPLYDQIKASLQAYENKNITKFKLATDFVSYTAFPYSYEVCPKPKPKHNSFTELIKRIMTLNFAAVYRRYQFRRFRKVCYHVEFKL